MLVTKNYLQKSFKISRSIAIAVLAELAANPPLVANKAIHSIKDKSALADIPAFLPTKSYRCPSGLVVEEINHAHLMTVTAKVRDKIAKIRAASNHPIGRQVARTLERMKANAPVGTKHRQVTKALEEVSA